MASQHIARVAFGRRLDHRNFDVLSALPLRSLLVCTESGSVFAPWDAKLQGVAPRLAPGVARTFYCSVCENVALRVTGGPNIASCGVCGWTASQAGLTTMTDLFSRETEGWPEMSARVNQLVEAIEKTRIKESRSRAATTERATDEELRGLKTAVASGDEVDESMRGAIDVGEIAPLNLVIPTNKVWKRCELPPRRRLPRNVLNIISPFTDVVVDGALENLGSADNAAKILPNVEKAFVTHPCLQLNAEEVGVHVTLRNVRGVAVTIVADTVELYIRAGECGVLQMNKTGINVVQGNHNLCDMSVALNVVARFDGDHLEWHYTMYVTHERRATHC